MASSAEVGNTVPSTAPTTPIVKRVTVDQKAQGSPQSRASPLRPGTLQLTHLVEDAPPVPRQL
eukprot:82913-Amphidinium_carterae.1